MAILVLLPLILAFVGDSAATWCVCRNGTSSTALQRALDYACGAGASCSPILQNGACYLPNTVLAHCSYAANSYYQRKSQVSGSCDFSGAAIVTTTDPSYPGCSYPSTASSAGTGTAPSSTTTTGNNNGGLGVLGPSTSTDGNGAGGLVMAGMASLSLALIFAGVVLLRA